MNDEMFIFIDKQQKKNKYYSSSCKTSFDRSERNGTEPGLLLARALAS
jgi:hypothetical protein